MGKSPLSSPYVVLARKWRSAQFSDVVGQTHVVRTLMNAIRSERVHQAYLFNGSRGIGKTSIARIFAKVLRCENRADQGDWLKSCDACSSCREIAASTSVDVIEIDGASNNGVEAVREIRENAKYLPSSGARKIYIIDEVHMLTTAAFNALLKTLEEPPAHVIFVFATTEPHKIPATILSRCQRFDFKRHTVAQIQPHLVQVALDEKIQADPAALAIIAKAAEGSMRDALSLLDQVIAFSGSTVTSQSVRDSIGLVGGQTLLGILRAIFARQALTAIALANDAYSAGHDLKVLSRGLVEFLHGIILIKVGAERSSSLEFSEEEWTELQSISELRPLEEMELIFQALHFGVESIARSPQPKIVLDVLLIKCALAEELVAVKAAIRGGASGTSGGGTGAKPTRPVAVTPAPILSRPPLKATVPEPVVLPIEVKPIPVSVSIPKPKSWEGFIEFVKLTRPLLGTVLEHGSALSLPNDVEKTLVLGFSQEEAYYREQLQARAYQEQLHTLARDYFGPGALIRFDICEGGESVAARKDRESAKREGDVRKAAMNHPIILEAKSLFGGELGPIELLESTGSESGYAP